MQCCCKLSYILRLVRYLLLALLLLASLCSFAQQTVTVRIDASSPRGALTPVWDYFGYDEPNNTYSPNGRKLIRELAQACYVPVHFRTHFLLATGDGALALKWGSTNAYTEDARGNPVYNWTLVDRILDTYLKAGALPFVEIGFMPQALSSHPEPYQPHWKPGEKFSQYYLGWTYPPRSYIKWSNLIYEWVRHSVAKYGEREVARWHWEVWNEPNIGYWHGTPQQYDELYDYTAAAVKRALPSARVGGPASTGPADKNAAQFLKQFLVHCASGKNYATGAQGAPLDFISFHAKGRPRIVDGHIQMGLSQEMQDAAAGFAIVRSFPEFRNLPVFISEADPEGCAACSAQVYPPNAYRNGTLYPAYEAAAFKTLAELARSAGANLQGVLTWAFEFENQPYFAGFRTLATHGIDKPVLNFFRMEGLLRGDWLNLESSAALPAGTIMKTGVRAAPDIDGMAVRSSHQVSVLLWNYDDEDVPRPAARISLSFTGLPSVARRVLFTAYRIDRNHSNAYTVWQAMGSPQSPSPEQYARLEAAGHLQLFGSPHYIDMASGSLPLAIDLPSESLSLVQLNW
jgi:xylan 1,4-beta-xylosidase